MCVETWWLSRVPTRNVTCESEEGPQHEISPMSLKEGPDPKANPCSPETLNYSSTSLWKKSMFDKSGTLIFKVNLVLKSKTLFETFEMIGQT